jgi:hypothetical protein
MVAGPADPQGEREIDWAETMWCCHQRCDPLLTLITLNPLCFANIA